MYIDYASIEYYLAATLLITAMIAMGTSLTPREFKNVARAPHGVVLVIMMQILVTPLLALGIAKLFNVPPAIAVGMLLVAALPGGLFSNVLAYLGRGNVALSVSATAICTLGCLLTTVIVLRVFGSSHLPDGFSMPVGRVLFEIIVCLLLPLILGMASRRVLPKHYERIGKVLMRVSFVLLAIIVVGSATSGRIDWSGYSWRAPAALFVFAIASIWLCYALGMLLKLSMPDCFTVAIEVVVRNAHLGILLNAALFPAVTGQPNAVASGVLFAVLFYGGISLGLGGYEVVMRRKRFGLHRIG